MSHLLHPPLLDESGLLTQAAVYLMKRASPRMVEALRQHKFVTLIVLLNPETGEPVQERKTERIKPSPELVNRILQRFAIGKLNPDQIPTIFGMPERRFLHVWPNGGWCLWGGRSKAEKGKRKERKGNIYQLYEFLARTTPYQAKRAIEFMDATKTFSEMEDINLDI